MAMRTMIVVCSILVALGGCSGVNISGGQGSQELAVQGKQWLDQQRYDEAIAAYREAVQNDPGYATAQYGLGVAYSRTGADAQATAAYREAIRLQPDNVDAYYGLGVASERQGRDDEAIAAYREVIRRRPEDSMAHYGLGAASARQGRDEEAIGALREAIRLNPGLADAFFQLGMLYARLRQDEQAMASYREAIRLRPGHADAYYGLGLIYTKQRQDDQALEAYRQALQLNPNLAEAFAGLGVLHVRARQDDQALEVYRRALRLNPNLPSAHYGMWGLFKLKGDASEAQRAWQAYQALVPDAGPEPDAHFAQTEMPEPPAPTAVQVAAARPSADPPPVQPPPPIPPSTPPPPAPARVSTERSAEATPKPAPVVSLPEAPAAPQPAPMVVPPEPPAAPVPAVSPTPLPLPPASPPPAVTPAPRAPVTAVTALSTSERRTALVIGNDAYRTDPLRNAVNDATDMARGLRQLGFEVMELHDAEHQRMEEGVEQFTRQLGRGGVGVFYYSGHGVQVSGLNYLVPVDARISRESDIKYQSVQVDWVLDRMRDAGNEVNIIILDACRNNPYARSGRNAQPGLAMMQAVSGSLIGYATSPGTTAEDGPGRNGTYTKHLLHFMQVSSLSAEQMFKEVRVAVAQETGKKQIPWVSTSILGDFYFAGK
jgi:tetratricopeptide (TPR) repeat protein